MNKNASARRLQARIDRFERVRLLVIGDLMLDHYIWGKVERISPEAPVPVVAVESETVHLGGAANVAQNIQALGGAVELAGVVGKDEAGQRLLQELRRRGLATAGVGVDPARPTTTKTRLMAHSQQVARIDREQRRALDGNLARELLAFITSRLDSVTGVVVSDYAKGMITPELLGGVIRLCRRRGVRVVVDPKPGQFPCYRGAQVVTPNSAEAFQAAGMFVPPNAGAATDQLVAAGLKLKRQLGCDALLITRGEHGMSLIEGPDRVTHIPTVARQVYDVTGAGDTVVATLALALGAGAPLREAASLANHAAGLAVGVVGTATVAAPQLRRAVGSAGRAAAGGAP